MESQAGATTVSAGAVGPTSGLPGVAADERTGWWRVPAIIGAVGGVAIGVGTLGGGDDAAPRTPTDPVRCRGSFPRTEPLVPSGRIADPTIVTMPPAPAPFGVPGAPCRPDRAGLPRPGAGIPARGVARADRCARGAGGPGRAGAGRRRRPSAADAGRPAGGAPAGPDAPPPEGERLGDWDSSPVPATVAPEPASLVLVAAGAGVLFVARRRRR
jgi:hypothetical protein